MSMPYVKIIISPKSACISCGKKHDFTMDIIATGYIKLYDNIKEGTHARLLGECLNTRDVLVVDRIECLDGEIIMHWRIGIDGEKIRKSEMQLKQFVLEKV